MKSARERALEEAQYYGPGWAAKVADRLEASFKEYGAECARLQRHACADAVLALDLCGDVPGASAYTRDDAYNAVLATWPPEKP